MEVNPIKRLISCEYNFDNCCVELKFTDGSMIAIDTIAVENEVADNMYQRSELDYLIYNDPIAYADLILNGDPAIYLKTVTESLSSHSVPKRGTPRTGNPVKLRFLHPQLADFQKRLFS